MREHDDRNGCNAAAVDAYKTMALEKASREKTWDECGIEEKVERLRRSEQETRAWLQSISQQLRNVPPHQHGSRGEVLIEQDRYGNAMGMQANRAFDPLA